MQIFVLVLGGRIKKNIPVCSQRGQIESAVKVCSADNFFRLAKPTDKSFRAQRFVIHSKTLAPRPAYANISHWSHALFRGCIRRRVTAARRMDRVMNIERRIYSLGAARSCAFCTGAVSWPAGACCIIERAPPDSHHTNNASNETPFASPRACTAPSA